MDGIFFHFLFNKSKVFPQIFVRKVVQTQEGAKADRVQNFQEIEPDPFLQLEIERVVDNEVYIVDFLEVICAFEEKVQTIFEIES